MPTRLSERTSQNTWTRSLAELTEDAEHAAVKVNESASDFLVAVGERRAVEQRTAGLSSLVRRMEPNSFPASRSDAAAVEVARFVDSGGETAPRPAGQ
jgi:hypothetical protein